MHHLIAVKRNEIAAACRRFGVHRLDLFGSAARGTDFDPGRSDADFLVDFAPGYGADEFLGLAEGLERTLGRPVGLVTRKGLEASHNAIRRTNILAGRELVYEAHTKARDRRGRGSPDDQGVVRIAKARGDGRR